jgi:hypothetical protein
MHLSKPTQSEPQCQLQTLGDEVFECRFVSCNTWRGCAFVE